ncbi:MAG: pilus assembly protein TadG-related protein [Hyphomicrobiales bacterium]|jgi:Flp pilus assembly protein TadG|nr:pilus assembly protein TadG-related protein [Hyphomicrobiales bacterium]
MMALRTFASIRRRFSRNQDGSVGMIFGLSLIPLLGLTGVTVDYGRAALVRAELQSAADATALALAKDSVSASPAQITARANAHFNANFPARFGSSIERVVVTKETDRFRVQATARIDYTMVQLIGPTSGVVSAEATSGWGINKIEIALVLDNTGSMGWSNKMQELKRALCGDLTCSNANPSSGFVKAMKDAAVQNDQIRVALVPFDTTVRVPQTVQTAVSAGWPMPDSFSYAGAGYCGANPNTAERVSWSLAGAPSTSWFRFANRDKDTIAAGSGCGPGRITRTTWRGCLWDRDQDSDRDTKPSGVDTTDIRTLYPAVTCRSNNLARMAPLVDVRTNAASLITSLAAMQPSGNTNVTIGATWGVNMLTPGFPMSTAIAPEANLNRFMILLTDGDNTENRTGGNQASIDARTRLACANAKAAGILVYTVRVIDGNRDLLRACASTPGNYYEVASATQLDSVFQSIASQIGGIRLTN